jgi:hypothetical protein
MARVDARRLELLAVGDNKKAPPERGLFILDARAAYFIANRFDVMTPS